MPFLAEIIEVWEIAERTIAWKIGKPEGFTFRAGQHVSIKLLQPSFADPKGPRRTFTIASSPQESDLLFITRNTGSGFKRSLLNGPQAVELWGPMGEMVHDGSSPAVFVAGGVGVSPFRSMIFDGVSRMNIQPMMLLHSDRTIAAAVFVDAFRRLQADFPQLFRYELFLTQEMPLRRIGAASLRSALDALPEAVVYLCGSEMFVEAMRKTLTGIGLPGERLRAELFRGYQPRNRGKEGE